jgi:hypothetical protein
VCVRGEGVYNRKLYSNPLILLTTVARTGQSRRFCSLTPGSITTVRSLRADSHCKSSFRSVAERHRSVKFSHVDTDRNVSVTSQFRSVADAERVFDGTTRVLTGLYLLYSDNVNSLTSPPLHYECLRSNVSAWFFLWNGWKVNRIGA